MRRLLQVTLVLLLACVLCAQVSAFSIRGSLWRSRAPKHDPTTPTEVAPSPDNTDAGPTDPAETNVPPPPVWTGPVGPARPGHTDPVRPAPWRPHGERRRLPPFHRPRHDGPRIRPIGPEHPPTDIRPVGPEVPSDIHPVGREDTDIHPVGPEIPIHPVGPEDGEAHIRPVGPEVPTEDGGEADIHPVGPENPIRPVGPEDPDSTPHIRPVGPEVPQEEQEGEGDIHPVGPEIPIRPVGPEDPDIHPVGPEVPIHPVGPEGEEGEMHILPVGPETWNNPPMLGEGGENLPPGINALPQEEDPSSSQSSFAKFIAKLRDRLRSGMEQSPIAVIRGSASPPAAVAEEPAHQDSEAAQDPAQESAQDFEPGFPEPAPMPPPMPDEEPAPPAVMPGESGEDVRPPFDDGPIPNWDTTFTDQNTPTEDYTARPRSRHGRRSYALNLWVGIGAGIALLIMLGVVIAQRRKMARLSAEMALLRMHMQYQQGQSPAQIVAAVPQQQPQMYAVAMPAQVAGGNAVSYMPLASAPHQQQGYVVSPSVQGYPSSGYVRLQQQQTVQ